MTPQTANGETALIEDSVKFFAKQLTMEDHLILYTITLNDGLEAFHLPRISIHIKRMHTSNHMEEHLTWIRSVFIILPKSCHQTVKAMPDMNLGHSNKVYLITLRLILVDGNAIEINTIANSNRTLPKDCLCVRKSDDSRHLLRQSVAEQLIDLQTHSYRKWEGGKFLIVRICGNLCHGLDAKFSQFSEEAYQKGICILEASGIDKLDTRLFAIINNRVIIHALAYSCQSARTIILYNCIVNIATTVSVFSKTIITEMHFVATFPESLYLIVYLLTDSANIGKPMINKK